MKNSSTLHASQVKNTWRSLILRAGRKNWPMKNTQNGDAMIRAAYSETWNAMKNASAGAKLCRRILKLGLVSVVGGNSFKVSDGSGPVCLIPT